MENRRDYEKCSVYINVKNKNVNRKLSLDLLKIGPMWDYEEKSVNKIFYDNDRRKAWVKSAFRLCLIYNSYKIACQ